MREDAPGRQSRVRRGVFEEQKVRRGALNLGERQEVAVRGTTIAMMLLVGVWASGAAQQTGGSDDGPSPALVEKIQELGGQVMRVAANDPGIEVAFHLGRDQDGLRQLDATGSGSAPTAALDDELGLLKDAGTLVALHLGGTDVTDDGLEHLAGLTSLTRLHLERTRVSDAGLAHLAGLKNLSYLNLYQTDITNAGLAHLRGLTSLRSLYLWRSKVTPEGAEALREALPECRVDLGWEVPGAAEESEEAPVEGE